MIPIVKMPLLEAPVSLLLNKPTYEQQHELDKVWSSSYAKYEERLVNGTDAEISSFVASTATPTRAVADDLTLALIYAYLTERPPGSAR